jgi:hypothetical protein
MNQSDFCALQTTLATHGFVITESICSPESFGSWSVTVSSAPPRRVVWDGKDGCLVVQVETEQLFQGRPVWRDLWVAKEPAEQTCQAALEALRQKDGAA